MLAVSKIIRGQIQDYNKQTQLELAVPLDILVNIRLPASTRTLAHFQISQELAQANRRLWLALETQNNLGKLSPSAMHALLVTDPRHQKQVVEGILT